MIVGVAVNSVSTWAVFSVFYLDYLIRLGNHPVFQCNDTGKINSFSPLWRGVAHAENFITRNDGCSLLCVQKLIVNSWLDGKIGP